MKKLLVIVLCLMCVISLSGCSKIPDTLVENNTLSDGRVQTITYSQYDGSVISISIYNPTTKITTESMYYYYTHGYGRDMRGSTVYTLDSDGKIISTSEGGDVE